MKNLLKEIQKLVPPRGTPIRMLDPGPPGSPTATFYEVIGEVELTPATQTCVGPSQPVGTPRPQESGRVPDPEQTPVHQQARSSQVRRKCTERLARSRHGPLPSQAMASKRSRMPKKVSIPERTRTLERTNTPDRGKALVPQASLPLLRIA